MIDRYIVDNVTLSRMTPKQRSSRFMRDFCVIPVEILHEARGLPDIDALRPLIYPVTAAVLDKVKAVMATITPQDKVVDLYNGKGNGDVMLLATALVEMAVSETQLIGDRWIVATDDTGLAKKAKELRVVTMQAGEFIALVAKRG